MSDAIGRRAMLAGMAAATPAVAFTGLTPAAPAAAAPHPDAELLELGRALDASSAREHELWQNYLATGDEGLPMDVAYEASSRLVDRIEAGPPARTLEGLRVKARAVLWCNGDGEAVDLGEFQPTSDVGIASSLINDLLAL